MKILRAEYEAILCTFNLETMHGHPVVLLSIESVLCRYVETHPSSDTIPFNH